MPSLILGSLVLGWRWPRPVLSSIASRSGKSDATLVVVVVDGSGTKIVAIECTSVAGD